MSTDLEFCPELPKLRLLSMEIQTPEATDVKSGATRCTIQRENNRSDAGELGEVEDDQCRTPTSEEHKIPKIFSCPPAPRKPRRVVACKRKLSELQFFEIVKNDEVEAFFGSPVKRSCPCK